MASTHSTLFSLFLSRLPRWHHPHSTGNLTHLAGIQMSWSWTSCRWSLREYTTLCSSLSTSWLETSILIRVYRPHADLILSSLPKGIVSHIGSQFEAQIHPWNPQIYRDIPEWNEPRILKAAGTRGRRERLAAIDMFLSLQSPPSSSCESVIAPDNLVLSSAFWRDAR